MNKFNGKFSLVFLSFTFYVLSSVFNFSHAANRRIAHTSRTWGAGLIIGEPIAATAKYWMDGGRAVDMGLGYSFDDYFTIYGDYLFHFPGVLNPRDPDTQRGSGKVLSQISPYVGIGAALFFNTKGTRAGKGYFSNDRDDIEFGVRVPLGAEWLLSDPSLGVFAEIVPGLGLAPDIGFLIQGGVGVRYYF